MVDGTLDSIEHAASQVAYERGEFSDLDLCIDGEREGFSHRYEQGALTIARRVLDPEFEKNVNRPSELRVTYHGKTVFLKSENTGKVITYIPGEWESLIQKEYADVVREQQEWDAKGYPF